MSEPTPPPTGDDLSDQDLDDRVRAAAEALLALAPEGKLDGLAARVDNELAQIDRREHRTESRMMSDTDKNSGRDDVPAQGKPARTEDSGLHDIKALAQDTRKRISRRITSQHDIDPALLSASHSGLRAVALPEPALVVSLPDVPTTMAEVRAASAEGAPAATASEGATITPITARKRTGLWIGVGVAGIAAAAVIAVVAGGGGSKKDADLAAEKQVAPQAVAMGGNAQPSAASQPSALAVAEPAGSGAGSAVAMEAGAGSAAPAPPAEESKNRTDDRRSVGSGSAAGGDKVETARPGRGGAADTTTVTGGAKPPPAAKVDPKAVKPGGTKPAGSGEKSIEDLLNDASGGPSKPKEAPGGGGAAPADVVKPEKTGLDTKDIKAGMGAVAGKAQACFDQHGVAGHVKVRATVAPSGSVSKVDATGEFAGTPTGACVAAAVKGASFPEWSGTSMTVNYSFTLQE